MREAYYHDDEGREHRDRRDQTPQPRKPSWLDWTIVGFIVTLIFSAGAQFNILSEVVKRVDSLTADVRVINASDERPDIAVLKERTHQQDQAISDLKDAILRRLDRMEQKYDSVELTRRK